MKMIFLGTGAAFSRTLFNNNLLLQLPTQTLCVDFGLQASRAMHALGMPITMIDNIFITHLHADHIGGLEEIALATKYFMHKRVTLYVERSMVEYLWEHSIRGGLEYTGDSGGEPVPLDYYFDIVPVDDAFTIDGVSFRLVKTNHVPGMASYGLYFNNILFTGDTQYDSALLDEYLPKSNIIFHDCDFKRNIVHTYFDELLAIPREKRSRVFLMHYSDGYEKHIPRVMQEGFRLARERVIMNYPD